MADTLSKVNQVRGVLPRGRPRSGGRQADRAGHGADVPVVQFDGDDDVADHRLSHPRRAAAAADGRRRRQRADPRRPDLRHAHLARTRRGWRRSASRANDVRNALAANNFISAAGEVEERLHPDQRRRADLARQRQRVRQAGGRRARRRAGAARRRRQDRARAAESRFLLDLRRAEGGVHRRLRHARGQPADRDRRHPQGDSRHPGAAARRPQGDDRLRLDRVHPRLDPRGRQDADRGGGRSSSSSSSCSSATSARPSFRSSPFRCR